MNTCPPKCRIAGHDHRTNCDATCPSRKGVTWTPAKCKCGYVVKAGGGKNAAMFVELQEMSERVIHERDEALKAGAEVLAALNTVKYHFELHKTEMAMMSNLLSRKQDIIGNLRGEVFRTESELREMAKNTLYALDQSKAMEAERDRWRRDAKKMAYILRHVMMYGPESAFPPAPECR